VQSAKTRTQEILAAAGRGETPASPVAEPPAPALATLGSGGYVAIHVYGDPDAALMAAIAAWRAAIQAKHGVPTTLGIGPRFLHSTGQLHKGGAPGGVFLQIVLDEGELPIPGEPLGFGRLIRAQADGDAAALRDRGRRVARLDVGGDAARAVHVFAESAR
jgi:hypothetical protein